MHGEVSPTVYKYMHTLRALMGLSDMVVFLSISNPENQVPGLSNIKTKLTDIFTCYNTFFSPVHFSTAKASKPATTS